MNNDEVVKKSIRQEIAKATVSILVDGQPKGTGFFITSDGYVLTAYHCIGVCPPEIRVKTSSGEHFIARLDEEKTSVPHDIAVLKVDVRPSLCLPLGVVSSQHVSDEVISLGYPGSDRLDNQQLGFYPGKIFRFRDDGKIETDAVRGGGQSGGPLYHYDTKRVVGVVVEHYWSKEVQQLSENKLVTAPPKVLAGLVVQLEPLLARWLELESITGQVAKEWEANPAVAALSYRSIPSNIPFSGAKEFVGREPELDTLHEQFQTTSRLVISAIAGMGGIGKTELAIQYALLHKADYVGGICWLPASAQDLNLGIQITEFAKSRLNLQFPDDLKKVEDQVGFCWQHWPLGEVLVVLDNVTHYEEVKSYLPSAAESRFKVLITTRQQMGQPIKQLDLDVLDEAASLALLEAHLGKERLQAELEVAKKLCAWLGFLPLGLELVGRYLAVKEDLSLVQMQQRLEKKRLQQVALVEPTPEMTAQRGVAAAFELSWEELDEKAQQLGCLLSLFAPAPIRWELAEQVLSKQDPEDLETVRDEQLRQLHLLQRKGQGIYQLHTLVREFLRVKLEESSWAKELKQVFAKTVGTIPKQFLESPQRKLFDNLVVDIFHLEEVAQNLTTELNDEDFIGPYVGIVFFYFFRGLPSRAEPWCQQWLSAVETRFKEKDLLFAKLLPQCLMGAIHRAQSKSVQAESCFDEVEKICNVIKNSIKEENPNDPSIEGFVEGFIAFFSSIPSTAKGQYGELESFTAQLKLMLSVVGENNPIIFQNQCNLAVSYAEQGRFEEAESTLQQALKVFQNSPNNIYVPVGLATLSEVYSKQKRYSEAENLLRQSWDESQRLMGDNNIVVGTTMTRLGTVCQLQNRYEEAESFYQQALELSKSLAGDNDINLVENREIRRFIALRLQDLANLYFVQKRFHDAEPLYVQVLEIFKDLWGENHLDVAISLTNLAHVYYHQKRYDKAEPLYRKTLEIRRQLLGNNHLEVATTLNDLANLYYDQNRYEEAESPYLQAMAIRKGILGEDAHDLNVVPRLISLANFHMGCGHHERAESLYIQSLEICKRLLDNDHQVATKNLDREEKEKLAKSLNQLESSLNQLESALKLFRNFKEFFDENYSNELIKNENEMKLCVAQNRISDTEPLLLKNLKIFENSLSKLDVFCNEVTQSSLIVPDSENEIINVWSGTVEVMQEMYSSVVRGIVGSLSTLSGIYLQQGYQSKAKQFLMRATLELSKYKDITNKDSLEKAITSITKAARVFVASGYHEEVEPLLAQILEIRENLLGNEHSDVADTLNQLGLVYSAQSRYSEAESLYKQALEINRKIYGEENVQIALNLNNLATIYRDQGRYPEAEPLFLRSLEICRKVLKNNDPDLARVMDNLGMVYFAQGRYSEAKSLHKQALAIFEKTLKADEPRLLRCRNNLKALPATTKEPNIFQKLRLFVFRK